MGTRQHITEYVYGEAIGIRADLHTRDGEALDLTGVAVEFILWDEYQRTKLLVISGADITVEDANGGKVLIGLTPERYRALKPETNYRYDLWSGDGDTRAHQAGGLFVLRKV